MPRLFPTLTLLFALGFLGCAHTSVPDRPPAPTPWPHEISDLKPDPAVRWGRLENGLRYAILPHPTPRQRANVFLLVQVGSYHERSSERGYAHFVEHMAFRDLRDMPEGAFATMEKLGAGHSPHSNGSTGPFETEYRFDNLPVDAPEALATGLKVLRAIADGIVFTPAGVGAERGVIFNEARFREAMMVKARPDELEFQDQSPRSTEIEAIFRGTRLVKRPPIGTERALRAATAEKLRAFYDRWYRPERMILTVVGDLQPDAVESLVRETFATLTPRGRLAAEPPIEHPKATSKLQVHADRWDTEPVMRLTLAASHPRNDADTIDRRRESLVRRMALDMLDRRYGRAAEGDNPSLISAEPLLSHIVPGLEILLLRADASPSLWPKALATLDFEVRRATEQGFTAPELQRAVKAETVRTAAAARQAVQRSSVDLVQTLALSIARSVVFTSAEDDRDFTAAQLAALTETQCQIALRELLPRDKGFFAIAGPFPEGTQKHQAAPKILTESRAAALTPYAPPPPLRPFPFTDFGSPGEVAWQEHSALLDADLVRFANGVRLNLKPTQFEPGRVRMTIRVDGGGLTVPSDKPGLDLRLFAWLFGGLRGLTSEELKATLTDLTSSIGLNVSTSELRINGVEDASNLPLLLQWSAAYFVRPDFKEETRALELARQIVAPYSVTAGGVAEKTLRKRLASDHPAVHMPTIEEISQRTLDELKAWLLPQLAAAPMEISIIGDFDPTTAIESVARTFGALAERDTTDPYAERRKLTFPPAPFSETVTFTGNDGIAAVSLAWPVLDELSYPARFRAQILAKILEQRLWQKLRVETGETYVLGASFTHGDTFRPPVNFLQCRVEAAPERVEHLATVLREVAATLARDGATAEELERARQPLVRATESNLRNNDWLLDMISVAQSNPAYAEGWARALNDYRSATLDEINDAARRWLVSDRLCQLIVRPK